jgi:hypothetical protein
LATFLELVNGVLSDLQEPVITDVTSTAGVQTAAVNAVLKATTEIYLRGEEWPFLYASTTQALTQGQSTYTLVTGYIKADLDTFVLEPVDLITNGTFVSNVTSWTDSSTGTGSIAHTTDGNGGMRLNAGSSGVAIGVQAVTTIVGKPYRVSGRTLTGTITLNIGTTSNGTEITTEDLAIGNLGDGEYFDVVFTPTAATTYISFTHAANANYDVDLVEVREDLTPQVLQEKSYEDMVQNFTKGLHWISEDDLGTPKYVAKTHNDSFLVYPVPARSSYKVVYSGWVMPSDMAVNADTPSVPDRYRFIIIEKAKWSILQLRSDQQASAAAGSEYEKWYGYMENDLLPKKPDARAT